MKRAPLAFCLVLSGALCAVAAVPTVEGSPQPPSAAATPAAPGANASSGRFQLIVVPGHAGSPFLLDSVTGCVWHQIYHQETKRTTFVEVDVENLHWGWGTGAQQLLATRVDESNLTDEQKRLMKESLQKTTCGLSSVVLTPGLQPSAGSAPTSSRKQQ